MKFLCLIVILGLIEGAVYSLMCSKLCYSFGEGCLDVPFLIPVILSLMILYGVYMLWNTCQIGTLFKNLLKKNKHNIHFNIDLIKNDDYQWCQEIKECTKNKKNLVAYSKEGALEARSKAKILGIEKYFVDFKSKEEVENERGW